MGVTIKLGKGLTGLGAAKTKLKSLSPVFKAIGDLELSQTKLRYIKEEDPDGNPWPDPITIRKTAGESRDIQDHDEAWAFLVRFHAIPKGWHFFDRGRDKVMRDTGILFNSIQRLYTDTYAIVGTNTKYGKKLQEGRFRFLGINKKTEDNIKYVIDDFLRRIFK